MYSPILAILAEHGAMTDDRLYRLWRDYDYPVTSRQNIGTARRELADGGHVRDTGRKGLSDMGNPARLWEIVPLNDDSTQGVK